jgi:PAS domain S-box-containing protein
MKIARTLSICIFLLCLAAAAGALNPDRDIHQLAHRSWGDKDGYPGRAEALAQTTDGFLWLGTDSGLFRFDGVHFERFVPRSGDSLSEDPVRGLRALSDGSLWITYRLENKICVLRNGNVKSYGKDDGVASNPTTIVQDHDGAIWANTEAGVIRFNGRRWERIGKDWTFPEDVPEITSDVLFVDSRGTLWAGVNHTILYLKQGSKRFEPTGVFAGWSASIAEGPDGTIWLSDILSYVRAISTSVSAKSAAIAKCEVETPKETLPKCPGENSPEVKIRAAVHLLFDRSGSLWMATDTSGVDRVPHPERPRDGPISETSDALQTFTSKDGLSADTCTPILEDREGNIWVATQDGLDQFRDTALVPVALPSSFYRVAMAPADGGYIWVVGSWAYVGRIHGDSSDTSFVHTDAFKAYRDPTGAIWLMGNSLGEWSDGRIRRVAQSPHSRGGSGPGMWQVASDRSGTLWAFSNGYGFSSLDHDRWKAWATPPALANQRVVNMFSDSTGLIWVSTYDGDIITMDRGTVLDYPREPNSTLHYIKAFAEHSPQEIWAGGAGGLVLIDRGHFRPIRPAAWDSLEDVTGIVDAGSNGLWLNTAHGVVHIFKYEVDRALRDTSYRFQSERFDSSDGLQGQAETLYPYPKAIQGTDGRIWFTATRGLAWVDPEKKISRNALPPPVSITSMSADGAVHLQLADLRLPARTANVQIDYTALSLSAPERVRFRYKLDGIDKAWQDVGTRRQAYYSNLGPGSYQFRVIACNNDGVWNETGDHLDFYIPPAWFQTNLFRLSCVAAFALLLWMLYLLRIHSIQQRSKQLAAINTKLETQIAENAVLVVDLELQVGLLQRLPVSAWTLQADGTPDFVNQVWLEFAGQTLEFIQSHPEAWMAAVHPEDRGMAAGSFWEGVHGGKDFAIQTRSLRAQDGTYRWHLQQAVVLRDEEGKVLKFVGTTTDIDDQKRTEEALRRAQGDLARINRVTTMGELSASLAHELSQPISGVITNTNVGLRKLEQDKPDLDEVRTVVTRIGRDAQRAAEILKRIRLQFERGALDREVVNINDILQETIALLRDEAVRYKVSVQVDLAADLPKIVGDRVQLQQVAMNLIVNGIEAMKDVDGSREMVIQSQRSESEQILVTVSDTGLGFAPQLAEQIFDPFFTTKPHGTGMGLRISRSIIESHGGRLWAKSAPAHGAAFHLILPATIPDTA